MKELYSKDSAKISSYMEELWQEDQRNKSQLNTIWRRNVDFANGAQQLSYSGTSSTIQGTSLTFTNSTMKRRQSYMTNEIAPVIRTLVAYMTRSRPNAEVFSADDSDQGENIAKIAEKVLEAKYDIDDEYNNSKMAAFWAMSLGCCFRKDFWDNSKGRSAAVPVFDELGNAIIDPNTGKEAIQNRNTGDNNVAVLTPFSIGLDWSITNFKEIPYIEEAYMMPTDWAREAFDQDGEGWTGKARKINDSGGSAYGSLTTLEELKYSTPFSNGTNFNQSNRDKTLIRELYVRPNEDFPRGRMVIKAGSFIVYDGPSQYYMPCQPVMWHPYSMFVFEQYIGRLLGKSLVEDLIPIQMRINEINGAILENANTVAKGGILAVEDQLKRGVLNGEGAQVTTYKLMPGAPAPQKWEGIPLPAQFFKEKQDLIEAIVRRVGTNFAMSGQVAPGITAAEAIKLLLDNSTSQQSDMMYSYADYLSQGYTKKIRIIHKFNDLPNQDLADYIRSISKDSLDVPIQDFIGVQDLSDGLVVKIEPSSIIPKSESAKRDSLKQLLSVPTLIPELGEDSPRGAEARQFIFKKLDIEPFDTEESADLAKAKWENEQIKKGLPPSPWEQDNHAVHVACHTTEFKKPIFIERANPQIKQGLLSHIQWHQEQIQMAQQQAEQQQMMMQQQQMAQQMAAQPPPEPKEPKGPPVHLHIHGQGAAPEAQPPM